MGCEMLEFRVELRLLLLDLAPHDAVRCFFDRSLDRADQASCDPVLEHEVGGALLEEFHCGILADRSCHDDGRNIRADFLGHDDGLAAVEVGQLVVDQNDVGLVALERQPILLLHLHPVPDEVEAALAEFPDDQFRVEVRILQYKDPDGFADACHGLFVGVAGLLSSSQ